MAIKGRYVDAEGYTRIKMPEHPYADRDGFVREHRIVVEKQIGRHLESDEEVHHIDDDPSNNDIDNLVILSKKEHAWWHGQKKTLEWDRKHGKFIKFLYFNTEMSAVDIAEELGVSMSGVYNYLRKNDIPLKGKTKLLSNPCELDKAKKMREAGRSFREIGREFGVGWSTVARRLRENGID